MGRKQPTSARAASRVHPPSGWSAVAAVRRRSGLGLVVGLLLAGTPAAAFHEQGVAACSGCHTIHNSIDGLPDVASVPGNALLKGENASEVCLNCHAVGYGTVLGSNPTNPPPELGAGNFAFLLEDDLNDASGDPAAIRGHRAGHSIVVPSRHLGADPDFPTAPGGTYPSEALGCTSCHDPHGSTAFRMLRGVGPVPGGHEFTYPAPVAEGVDIVFDVETRTRHTAYQGGWTDWCANCHGYYHEGTGGFDHPADRALGYHYNTYNAYDGPLNPEGGSYAIAYLPEVPFEDPAVTVDGTTGPGSGSSRINCMSCHRAHATSAPAALRWDPNVLHLGDDGVASFSYPIPNPYGDPEQLSLCVKCHYPEVVTHGLSQPCMECHRFGEGMSARFGPGLPVTNPAPGGALR